MIKKQIPPPIVVAEVIPEAEVVNKVVLPQKKAEPTSFEIETSQMSEED